MRVDIYRRTEAHGKFSHLVVPEGRPIPQEAINTDWENELRGQELDEGAAHWDEFGIPAPAEQLREKGYAITGLREQTD